MPEKKDDLEQALENIKSYIRKTMIPFSFDDKSAAFEDLRQWLEPDPDLDPAHTIDPQ